MRIALMALFILGVVLARLALVGAQVPDQILEGARREGRAKVGITVRWEEGGKPGAKRMVEAFQTRYPFVKVEYERVGGSRERERIFSEMTAGKVTYDVTALSQTQVPIALKANVVELIDWVPLKIRPQHINPEKAGVYYRQQLYGISYNRKLLPESVAAKFTWEDCANPKWRKKVAMDTRPRHLEIFWQAQVWGREKTLAHARQLAENQTIFERDRSGAMTKLALGESPIVCGAFYSSYYEQTRSKDKENIGFHWAEPIPINMGEVVFVPKGAAHPNAARLWILWSLSDEGHKILDEVEGSASPLVAGTQSANIIKGKKVAWYEPKWSAKAEEMLNEIIEALGLPVVR